MTLLGDYLKQQRLRQKISLVEIADCTRIHPRLLYCIENDRYELLPPPTILKGFLRSYALCLSLEPEDIVLRYNVQSQTAVTPSINPVSTGKFSQIHKVYLKAMAYLTGNEGYQVF